MINDDKAYGEAVNLIGTATFMRTLENGMSREKARDLHEDLKTLQEVLEVTADTFGKPMSQVEADVMDVIENLPIEDIQMSRQLAEQGLLN